VNPFVREGPFWTPITPQTGFFFHAESHRYVNALAGTVIGLFKTEVIRRRGPWRSMEAVEFATLEWLDWFMRGPPVELK
jgi:hypothetical protein